MSLDRIDHSLLLAAWFRGRRPADDEVWTSNADQVVTLSLFYTGHISAEECIRRFSRRPYISNLYGPDGELTEQIAVRDQGAHRIGQKSPRPARRGRRLGHSVLAHLSSLRIDRRRHRSGT